MNEASPLPADLLSLLREAAAALPREPARARRLAEGALALAPGHPLATHHLAEALAREGDPGRAGPLFRRAVAADGRLAEIQDLDPSEELSPTEGAQAWIGRFDLSSCPLCGDEGGTPAWCGNLSRLHRCHGRLDPVRTWVRCETCGLLRVERPVPEAALESWESLQDAAAPSAPPDPSTFGMEVLAQDVLVQLIRDEGYGNAWADRGDQVPPRPRLLEVGSGWGSLLAAARWRGFEAIGMEQAPVAATWCRETLDFTIHEGTVEDRLPDGPFDVVVLSTPLDILSSPMATLAILAEQLEPEGLLVLSVPTFDHPVHQLRGYDDPLWSEPGRRVWFDRKSLALAMLRSGLQPVFTTHDPTSPGSMRVLARREPDE